MPQADANAFKVLKRNHGLLNRKSRKAFDIYTKNSMIKAKAPLVMPLPMKETAKKYIDAIVSEAETRNHRILIIRFAITIIVSTSILLLVL